MIKSEWIKLWSVRSTYLALLVGGTLMVMVAVIFASTVNVHDLNTPTDALQGAAFGQLAFGVLGVLVIASEYSTGLIRTTFAAVPERRKVILAKGGLLFVVLYVAGQLLALIAFFAAQLVLASRGVHFSIADKGLAQSVTGIGFYLCFIGMFGFCLGALIRHTTGALATLFGLVFIVMGVIPQLLPHSVRETAGRFTFLKIAQSLGTAARPAGSPENAQLLSTPMAWLACFAYLAVAVAIPLLIINRRDAV